MKRVGMLLGAGAALLVGSGAAMACPGQMLTASGFGPASDGTVVGALALAKIGGAALLVMAAAMIEVVAFVSVRKFIARGNPHVLANAASWSRRGITQAIAVVALVASVACSLKVGLTPIVLHGWCELWIGVAAVWFGALAGTAAGAVVRTA